MSVADVAERSAGPVAPRLLSTRFFRSELLLIFGRRRNQFGLGVLAVVPIIIGVSLYISGPEGEGGGGPGFLAEVTSNGVFLALVALTVELPLFLPLAVAAISGDSVAGEANLGTLRYLLTVPVHRARLLAVKFAAIVVFCFAATFVVAGTGSLVGLLLFDTGPVTLLSGTQISFAESLWRLLLVCGYLGACMIALGAIGLFISTLTEQPIGATIAIMILAVASQILGQIPQLKPIHDYLPTRHWMAFGDLLRDPIATESVTSGLISVAAYTAIFLSLAWARFSNRDVSS
jgi:ABC-2 type transport system permease protein